MSDTDQADYDQAAAIADYMLYETQRRGVVAAEVSEA